MQRSTSHEFNRRLFRVSYDKVFTTKAQSSPSSENFLIENSFSPCPQRLRGTIFESCSTGKTQ